ncbi:MAG: hypothetical protein M5U01_41050 [Ardenticatenaceae bacterium]|nr:hypothetical protein [Ardenticatenaceae bacterium]
MALKSATRLGNELLSGLCGRRGPLYAPSEVECSGGGMAAEREMRTVPTKTR